MARFGAVEEWLSHHLTTKTENDLDTSQIAATHVRRAAASPSCTGPANLCEKAYTSVSDQTIPIALGVA